jgi:hypothetical protein
LCAEIKQKSPNGQARQKSIAQKNAQMNFTKLETTRRCGHRPMVHHRALLAVKWLRGSYQPTSQESTAQQSAITSSIRTI